MFDFFKKNKPEESKIVKQEAVAPPKESVKADNIAIYVMPEHFRNQPVKQTNAKTTGLLIIIGGAVILLLASAALYYFLFRKPSPITAQKPPLAAENNQPGDITDKPKEEDNQPLESADNLIASGTEITTLPSGEETATTTLATTTPEIAPKETGLSLRVGADTDSDGLTDIEEILLGTSSTTPDTDSDGYFDGSELINLYNPAGGGELTANSYISLYENKTFAYELFYPSVWQTSVNGGDDSLMFKSGDNQFIQVIVQPNANKQTLDNWYLEQLGLLAVETENRLSGANWQGIKNPDGLTIYIIDKKQSYIFSLTYNPGGSDVLEYFNIFQMAIKSFILHEN